MKKSSALGSVHRKAGRQAAVVLCLAVLLCALTVPALAAVKQDKASKTLYSADRSWSITACAAFDHSATKRSNANFWNYASKAAVKTPPCSGVLQLSTVGTAEGKNAWNTVIQTAGVYRKTDAKGNTIYASDTSDIVVQPSKLYKKSTVGIQATALFGMRNGQYYRAAAAE